MAILLDASPRRDRTCRVPLVIAAATGAAAVMLYAPVIARLARQWTEDADAGYGAIVAGAAAWLLFQRRSRVRSLPMSGSTAGLLVVAAACVSYVAGTLAADLFLLRVSLPLMLTGALLYVAGPAHVRALAAPLALVCLAIPPPSALVTEITMPLQLMASQCAEAILSGIGVPVSREGNVLTLSYITLQVAEACNGMRSLLTLTAVVAVYAAMRELPFRRFAVLAAAVVPVALVGNGLRVAVTALLAARLGAEAARGPVHEVTGWAAFVLMCLALYGSESITTRVRVNPDPGQNQLRPGSETGQSRLRVG